MLLFNVKLKILIYFIVYLDCFRKNVCDVIIYMYLFFYSFFFLCMFVFEFHLNNLLKYITNNDINFNLHVRKKLYQLTEPYVY